MTHPMNTASVLLEDKQRFQDALHGLMFNDGIGPFEARSEDATVRAYAESIFGKAGPTAVRRVRDGLFQYEKAVAMVAAKR